MVALVIFRQGWSESEIHDLLIQAERAPVKVAGVFRWWRRSSTNRSAEPLLLSRSEPEQQR